MNQNEPGQGLETEIHQYFQFLQSMDNLYEEYARKNGLTYMSLYILETIYSEADCTQKLISQITLYPKQTVNMVIRSFMEKGWVTLEQSENDRRNKLVRLTEAGAAFARQVVEPYWDAGECAFSELDPQDRRTTLRTLKAFGQSFTRKIATL